MNHFPSVTVVKLLMFAVCVSLFLIKLCVNTCFQPGKHFYEDLSLNNPLRSKRICDGAIKRPSVRFFPTVTDININVSKSLQVLNLPRQTCDRLPVIFSRIQKPKTFLRIWPFKNNSLASLCVFIMFFDVLN